MTDEEFVFRSDSTEKKRIGYSAKNKKRGGGRYVRMPSDNLTKKEREKLNGEITTYNLGKPMKWKDFRAMPMEFERQYIENIRKRFPNIPNSELALMFGMSTASLSKTFKAIGIKTNQKHGENLFLKDAEKYNEWLFWSGTGAKHVNKPEEMPTAEMPPAESETALEEMNEYDEPVCEVPGFEDATPSAPCSGEIVWNGNARQIFDALAPIIGTENVKLKISWEVCA